MLAANPKEVLPLFFLLFRVKLKGKAKFKIDSSSTKVVLIYNLCYGSYIGIN